MHSNAPQSNKQHAPFWRNTREAIRVMDLSRSNIAYIFLHINMYRYIHRVYDTFGNNMLLHIPSNAMA